MGKGEKRGCAMKEGEGDIVAAGCVTGGGGGGDGNEDADADADAEASG